MGRWGRIGADWGNLSFTEGCYFSREPFVHSTWSEGRSQRPRTDIRSDYRRGPSRQSRWTLHRSTWDTDRKDWSDVQGRHTHSTRRLDQEASDADRGRSDPRTTDRLNERTNELYSITLLYHSTLSLYSILESLTASPWPWPSTLSFYSRYIERTNERFKSLFVPSVRPS